MQRRKLVGQRLVAVFLLGMLLFNYPVVSLFDSAALFLGMPRIFVYLFLVWAGLIGLMILIVERHTERSGGG